MFALLKYNYFYFICYWFCFQQSIKIGRLAETHSENTFGFNSYHTWWMFTWTICFDSYAHITKGNLFYKPLANARQFILFSLQWIPKQMHIYLWICCNEEEILKLPFTKNSLFWIQPSINEGLFIFNISNRCKMAYSCWFSKNKNNFF